MTYLKAIYTGVADKDIPTGKRDYFIALDENKIDRYSAEPTNSQTNSSAEKITEESKQILQLLKGDLTSQGQSSQSGLAIPYFVLTAIEELGLSPEEKKKKEERARLAQALKDLEEWLELMAERLVELAEDIQKTKNRIHGLRDILDKLADGEELDPEEQAVINKLIDQNNKNGGKPVTADQTNAVQILVLAELQREMTTLSAQETEFEETKRKIDQGQQLSINLREANGFNSDYEGNALNHMASYLDNREIQKAQKELGQTQAEMAEIEVELGDLAADLGLDLDDLDFDDGVEPKVDHEQQGNEITKAATTVQVSVNGL
ncbi:MAG: hypothetical protein ACFHVJ_10990 [Aestuariibacter sp.]